MRVLALTAAVAALSVVSLLGRSLLGAEPAPLPAPSIGPSPVLAPRPAQTPRPRTPHTVPRRPALYTYPWVGGRWKVA